MFYRMRLLEKKRKKYHGSIINSLQYTIKSHQYIVKTLLLTVKTQKNSRKPIVFGQ